MPPLTSVGDRAARATPTGVVVHVDTTTICGTDLHLLQGDVAAVTDGRILGHEAVGTVTEVGSAVTGFSVGDRVLAIEAVGTHSFTVDDTDQAYDVFENAADKLAPRVPITAA